jgi:hypothetical protein
MSVALSRPNRLRQSDHVGASAASERGEVVVGWRASSLLRRLNARPPEVLMRDANENRYLLHLVLRKIQELIAISVAG